jgi:hypothetical protein
MSRATSAGDQYRTPVAARTAVLLGLLGVLAVPAGAAAGQWTTLSLLGALYIAAPVAFGFAVLALLAIRRSRIASQRRVFGSPRGPFRTGRVLAWFALYVAVTSGIALGVYTVLRDQH